MSVLDCLGRLAREGRISDDARREAEDIYNGFKSAAPFSTEAEHALNVAKAMEKTAAMRRQRLYLNTEKTTAAFERMKAGKGGAVRTLRNMLSPEPGVGGLNVEDLALAWETKAVSTLNAALNQYGSKMAGLKGDDIAGIHEMIHEMRGTGNGSGKVAAAAGKGWKGLFGTEGTFVKAAQAAGKMFHAAEDFGTPQHWESARARKFGVRQVTADYQRDIDAGVLDIIDPATHEPSIGERRAEILSSVVDKIIKDLPRERGTVGAVFSPDMRILRYAPTRAGTDAYIRAMEKYGPGQGGWLGMLQAHTRRASSDLALMHLFGPDYPTNLDGLYLKGKDYDLTGKFEAPQTLKGKLKDMNLSPLQSDYATRKMIDYTTGRSSQVGNETVANFFNGYRGFITARKLGGATITAGVQDQANMMAQAQWLGLNRGRMWGNLMRAMFTGMNRDEMARMGIMARSGVEHAIATKRYADQWLGEGLGQRVGNLVVRASFLDRWDKVLRSVFQSEFLTAIGDRAGQSFARVDGNFKDHFLTVHGFTPDEWKILSDPANQMSLGRARMLDIDKLSAIGQEALRQKLLTAMFAERRFGYIVGGSNRVRALTHGAPAGTLAGEVARNAFLYKTWGATYMATWVGRALQEPGIWSKLPIISRLALYAAGSGAMVLTLKSLLSGKDPPNLRDPWFWLQAEIQGGVAGVASDYVRDAFSRDNTTLMESLLGPISGDIKDVTDLFSKTSREISGEKVSWGSALARDLRDFTPGSSLWYGRLLAQRLIFDQWQKMIDPDWARSFERQKQRLEKFQQQHFYWLPGETSPQRAPQMSAPQ